MCGGFNVHLSLWGTATTGNVGMKGLHFFIMGNEIISVVHVLAAAEELVYRVEY